MGLGVKNEIFFDDGLPYLRVVRMAIWIVGKPGVT
jgi:hypothetical protein